MSKIPLDMDGDAGGDDSEVDEEVFALEGAESPRITIRQKKLQHARSAGLAAFGVQPEEALRWRYASIAYRHGVRPRDSDDTSSQQPRVALLRV